MKTRPPDLGSDYFNVIVTGFQTEILNHLGSTA